MSDQTLKENFGVRGRPKRCPLAFEFRPKLLEVEELTVVDNRPTSARVAEGLICFGVVWVDDGEPAVLQDETDFGANDRPLAVRATMAHVR
jgi:hypothetical protein